MVTSAQKDEAIKRMIKLKLIDNAIEEFRKDGIIEYSEPVYISGYKFGALYWVHNEPEWLAKVKEFEEKNNSLVYHVIHSHTQFGELLNLLYVSDDEEEWEMDNEDIEDGYAVAYVINLDAPDCSEFGSIAIRESGGGLLRVG